MQIRAKKGGKKNGKNTLAAMTMLLEGLADGEEVSTYCTHATPTLVRAQDLLEDFQY